MIDIPLGKLPSDECNWILLMISQYWFRKWLGAVRQQAITWANVDPDLYRHMAWLGHHELDKGLRRLVYWRIWACVYMYIYMYIYIKVEWHIWVSKLGQHWFIMAMHLFDAKPLSERIRACCWINFWWNLNENTTMFIQEIVFQNVICIKAAILCRCREIINKDEVWVGRK